MHSLFFILIEWLCIRLILYVYNISLLNKYIYKYNIIIHCNYGLYFYFEKYYGMKFTHPP
jgi:hypothetical protein